MLCAACGLEIEEGRAAGRCPHCEGEPLLDGRYLLREVVGEGSVGVTYRAERVGDGEQVAIKELSMRRLTSFKDHELFEREAQILKQLNHFGVPRYVEDFIWGVGKHQAFYLVEELIVGETLASELTRRRYDEREVIAWLQAALEVASYLHERSPPVIHRDLKPENIMRREGEGVVFVDFGVVRDGPSDGGVEGTLVGTPGYTAPEQVRGAAYPESDLYALAVVACVMLTRRDASWLMGAEPGARERRWYGVLEGEVSEATLALLYELLKPSYAHRPRVAREVKARVEQIGAALDQGLRPEVLRPRGGGGVALMPVERAGHEVSRVEERESMFGVMSAVMIVSLLTIPCVTAIAGFMNAMVFLCVVCLGTILVVPFLSSGERELRSKRSEEPKRLR